MFVAFVPFVYFRRKSEQKLTKLNEGDSETRAVSAGIKPFIAFVSFCFRSPTRDSQIGRRQPLIRRRRN